MQKKTKLIAVAEYVLPKFDVTIDAATDFSVKDGKIRAIIRSKYTYGKLVKGEAIVSLTESSTRHYYRDSASKGNSVLKTIPINGKGTVEFDVPEFEEDLKSFYSGNAITKQYELRATVVEELSGRNQSTTKDITIHQTRYKFEPNDMTNEFSPGIPQTFSVNEKN